MRGFGRDTESLKCRASSRAGWLFALGCLVALLFATGVGLIRTQAQQAFPLPAINPPGAKALPPSPHTAPAPAAQPAAHQAGATAEKTGTPEVAKECADLLKLATDLKTAVDKSSASTLSVTVVRKADEIEQLAHRVRITNGKS